MTERMRGKHQLAILMPKTLEEMTAENSSLENKTAYYVGVDKRGHYVFGVVGNAKMFVITEALYNAVGSPRESEEVKVASLIEKLTEKLSYRG